MRLKDCVSERDDCVTLNGRDCDSVVVEVTEKVCSGVNVALILIDIVPNKRDSVLVHVAVHVRIRDKVCVSVRVSDGKFENENDGVGVALSVGKREMDAVWVPDGVSRSDGVCVGDFTWERVRVCDAVMVKKLIEADAVAVGVADRSSDAVTEAVADAVNDKINDGVVLSETV